MEVTINNYNELLEFIKRDDINAKQALEIVCKALKVIAIFEITKDELIKKTEYHINKFCQGDKIISAIVLGQTNFDFEISDVFNSN